MPAFEIPEERVEAWRAELPELPAARRKRFSTEFNLDAATALILTDEPRSADYFESWETEGWHYENSEFPADNPNGFHWYSELLNDPEFQALLSDRWSEHRAGPWSDEALMADIDATALLLNESQEHNFGRWDVLGEYIWPNDEGAVDRETYAEEVEYLKNWLLERTAWLDAQWRP